ncbi:MAG: arginine--tRNA ligase [Phycisphaeraceae bacterium]
MPDLQQILIARLQTAVAAAFGDAYAKVDPLVRLSAQAQFGDYQANLAMSLSKQVNAKPRDVAGKIVEALSLHGDDDIFAKIEIAGPGFINLHLTDAFLSQQLNAMASDAEGRLGVPKASPPLTVVVDYSSPNVAKEMHVGHLRSTIIGDSIARVLEYQGHKVIRQNHLGDWGTQFGMLIEHLIEKGLKDAELGDLTSLYQEAKRRFDAEPDFSRRARKRVVSLQGGDEETLSVWRRLVEASATYFQRVYNRLGVLLEPTDIRGESFYNDRLAPVMESLQKAGLLSESEGATVVTPPGFMGKDGEPLPMIVRKSDGGFLYATTDLAGGTFRVKELGASRVIYVTGAPQAQHFAMVFAVLKMMGVGEGVKFEHVPFGSVLGPDGKVFKTREGNTVRLEDLIQEAEERAAKVIAEKNPDLPAEERTKIAHAVGIGALKYADLSSDRIKDYIFDWDRMLAFDGNTAPYIQNAFVRVHGIFRKGNVDPASLGDKTIVIAEPAEHALALKLLQLPSVIESVAQSLEPHRMCTYLYETAAAYHKFFETCPVLTAPNDATRWSRLRLSAVTAATFKLGLGLLGIETIERM